MAGTNADVDTPAAVLVLLGLAAMAYGGAMLRWWREFARFARRFAVGTKNQLESMWGTDEVPRRGMVSTIGAFFAVWGVVVIVIGLTKLS
jgi:hypothetical protein